MKAARVCAIVAFAVAAAHLSAARQAGPRSGTGLEVVKIRPNFYMFAGAGGNIGVHIGRDGVIVVDSGSAASADAALAEIKALTPLPVRYIINTSENEDHVGGNEKFARAGESLFLRNNLGPGGGGNTAINNDGAASIIGTENMFLRMSGVAGEPSRYPTVAQPTETFARRLKVMYLNDESIQILHPASAHTDGDAIVLFRRSDVLLTGDVFDMTRFPVIDLARGGTIQGEIDVLNQLIDLAVPSIPLPWKEGGTTVIPGHGRASEQAELVEYRDMVTIVRDRIKDMIDRRMTLDQIKAARPTRGWDRRFGSDSGPWTTNMFVEAVYKSLMAGPKT
jgi:glyoxylase-like metal-dependent hydrolase (beta-lactamase superfamily II)